MIVGVGVDIVEIGRIAALIKKHAQLFITRVFNQQEIDYCLGKSRSEQHFAGKFAAKEAVYKALDYRGSISWKDIEIINAKDSNKPQVRLHNELEKHRATVEIKGIYLSISHSRHYAIAQVVTEK